MCRATSCHVANSIRCKRYFLILQHVRSTLKNTCVSVGKLWRQLNCADTAMGPVHVSDDAGECSETPPDKRKHNHIEFCTKACRSSQGQRRRRSEQGTGRRSESPWVCVGELGGEGGGVYLNVFIIYDRHDTASPTRAGAEGRIANTPKQPEEPCP